MSIKIINLNKLLRLCMLQGNGLIGELRSDLRAERNKKLGIKSGGGHFQYPWWTAAKEHAIGTSDLEEQTLSLIDASRQRKRLYPLLTAGFLNWLNHVRRTTNLDLDWQNEEVHTHYAVPGLELTVKVDNLLALIIGGDKHKLIYPYFSEFPVLEERWARVGLWLMREALSEFDLTHMEILDVLRGRSFEGSSLYLKGDEEALFSSRYSVMFELWESLKPEYNL